MKPLRGKTAAFTSLALAVLVAALALWANRGYFLECWWLRQLDSRDPSERRAAALRLGEVGSARAVPRLLEIVEWQACPAYAIEAAARAGPRAIDALAAALAEGVSRRIRRAAVQVLAKLGPPAVPVLAGALDDEDAEVCGAALQALKANVGRTEAEFPLLRRVLAARHSGARYWAASSLRGAGARGIAVLFGALAEPSAAAGLAAARALERLAPWSAASLLEDLEKGTGPLAGLDPSALPGVIAALKTESWDLHLVAAAAAGHLGPRAAEAAPLLAGRLGPGWRGLLALEALVRIGPAALPALRLASSGESEGLRERTALAMRRIESAARAVAEGSSRAGEETERTLRP